MLQKTEMREYCKKYHKDHYVSNTTTRDTKNHEILGKLLLNLVGCSKHDAGKHVKAEALDIEWDSFSWSNVLVTNQEALANNLDMSRSSISRWLAKAEALGYVTFCGTYLCDNATRQSNTYIINLDKVKEDFDDLNINENILANQYYDKLHVSKETNKDSIAINNACMKQKVWQDLKAMIEEDNQLVSDEFRIKFLNMNNNGDYVDSRYFSKLCSTYNPERHPESDRYELVNRMFGTNTKIIEIDVNAMMYRTNYNLINDTYLVKDTDVYYEIYKLMTAEPMTQPAFKKYGRDLIKKELMSIYMCPKSVYCKTHGKALPDLNKKMDDYNRDQVLTVFGMDYDEFLNRLKEALYKFLSVYDFEGDKRVFFGRMYLKYESLVYCLMHREFRSRGIKSANVYDGFYFIEGTCNEDMFYEVYNLAIDKAKQFLADHNHDLVKIYGKKFTLKYRVYKKVEPKSYPKTERQKGTYDVVSTKKVEHVDAETHNQSRNDYVEKIKQRALELEAQGKKAFY